MGRLRIASPQDFWSGLVLLLICAAAWGLTMNLSGMRGSQLGAGVTVRIFILVLAVSSAIVLIRGLTHDGPPLPFVTFRGPIMVTAAVVFFSLAVRPLGLAITCFCTVMLASLASREIRLHEALIVSVVLTVFAVLAFHYGLRLPIPAWPRF